MVKSKFVQVFGENPFIKVMDVLIESEMADLSKTEIEKISGISRVTLNKIWPVLVKERIIKKTRELGNAKLYILNKSSPVVKKLIELDNTLIKQQVLGPLKVQSE